MFKETHCQVTECPHGKSPADRCRYNDAEPESPEEEVRLRVRCKRDGNQFVIASTKPVHSIA